jgi:hypothetical protein
VAALRIDMSMHIFSMNFLDDDQSIANDLGIGIFDELVQSDEDIKLWYVRNRIGHVMN